MKQDINSVWTIMKRDCPDEVSERTIQITMTTGSNGNPLVKFLGGPTGYENAYLDDVMSHIEHTVQRDPESRWAICGGTINSWPKCTVLLRDVLAFIRAWEKAGRLLEPSEATYVARSSDPCCGCNTEGCAIYSVRKGEGYRLERRAF